MLVILNLITATVGLRLSINYAEQSSSTMKDAKCAEEHPAFNEQYTNATTVEFFDCYKTWHKAKLNALLSKQKLWLCATPFLCYSKSWSRRHRRLYSVEIQKSHGDGNNVHATF